MPLWEAQFQGSIGYMFRLRVQVDLVGQNEDQNFSTIRYNAWFEKVVSGGSAYNYNTTYGNTNINGHNPQRSIGGYNFNSGTGQRVYLALNENYNIGHDGNGNANPYFAANYNAANSPYLTNAATGGNWSLPNLYQGIAVNSVSFNEVTDVSFKVRVQTNRWANRLELSINGGAWTTYHNGGFSDVTVQVGSATNQLLSNSVYSVRARVRRNSNNNLGESGSQNVTTSSGAFFDLFEF